MLIFIKNRNFNKLKFFYCISYYVNEKKNHFVYIIVLIYVTQYTGNKLKFIIKLINILKNKINMIIKLI